MRQHLIRIEVANVYDIKGSISAGEETKMAQPRGEKKMVHEVSRRC